MDARLKEVAGRRKAAILCVSLGPEGAAEVFRHLPDDMIELLTVEMARLQNVEPEIADGSARGGRRDRLRARDTSPRAGWPTPARSLERAMGTAKAGRDPRPTRDRDRGDPVRVPPPLAARPDLRVPAQRAPADDRARRREPPDARARREGDEAHAARAAGGRRGAHRADGPDGAGHRQGGRAAREAEARLGRAARVRGRGWRPRARLDPQRGRPRDGARRPRPSHRGDTRRRRARFGHSCSSSRTSSSSTTARSSSSSRTSTRRSSRSPCAAPATR